MSFRQFAHEVRTVARDTRWVSPIPALLVLITFFFWQSAFVGDGLGYRLLSTTTGGKLSAFLDTSWLYVGWLAPWWLMRGSGLRDETAHWRTGPVGKWTWFGSRLAWAFFATVLLPTLIAGGFCATAAPVLAIDQMSSIAWIQMTLFGVGVFAAFVARGDRGVWIALGLGILWYVSNIVGEELTKRALYRWIFHAPLNENVYIPDKGMYPGWASTWSQATSWPAIVAWVGIPVVVTLWIPWTIRNAARRTRWWPWIPFVIVVSLVAETSLLVSHYRKPAYPAETLPTVRMAMNAGAPRESDGYDLRDALGWCRMTLPEPAMYAGAGWSNGGFGEYWGDISNHGYSETRLSGRWRCGDLTRPISFNQDPEFLSLRYKQGTSGYVPVWKGQYDRSVAGSPGMRQPLKDVLGRPGIRLWMAFSDSTYDSYLSEGEGKNIRYEWGDTDAPIPTQNLWFSFRSPWVNTPEGRSSEQEFPDSLFKGHTVDIALKMRVWRRLPPTLVGRVPVLRGGEFLTPKGWKITVAPAQPDDTAFQIRYAFRAGPVELRPKLPENYARPASENYQVLLYNAVAGQAIFLSGEMSGAMGSFSGYRLPTHAPSLAPEWFADAEIVVLEYKDEPVTLPLEFTLKMPKGK